MTRKTLFKKMVDEFIKNKEYVETDINGFHKLVCPDYYIELLAPNTDYKQVYDYELHVEANDGVQTVDLFELYKNQSKYKWVISHLKNIGINLEWMEKQ